MSNKNIFSSLLSTITTIGSLSIIASCGYDAYNEAKKTANADVYNLNLQTQINNPLNANMLINNPYQSATYMNYNQSTDLQTIETKTKGYFRGAINSLSGNFITISAAALGAIFNRNSIGKVFFVGAFLSKLFKGFLKFFKSKLNKNQKQINSMALYGNQAPFSQVNTMSYSPVVSNVPLGTGFATSPTMNIGTPQVISPAYPYIPNNSPYIPLQMQMRLY